MRATHRPSFLVLLPLLALAGAPACDVADEADDLGAVELRPGGGCSWCGLAGNAANVNGADLSDINLDGTNTAGIKLRPGNLQDNTAFVLEVDPDTERFYGVSPTDPDVLVMSDEKIVGGKIVLEMPDTGQTVHLEITHYDDQVASWSAEGGKITAYRAQYVGSQNTLQPLCPDANPDNQWFTLILGEIYDGADITAASRSVTIACVGEAAAKMKLMGYGPNGSRGASTDERRATLRMITADYCGDGASFTVNGTPVAWRDSIGSVLPPFEEQTLEAKWGPEGALCLDTPRHADLEDVLERCEIPACEGDDGFGEGVVWRTMLPGE